MENFTHSFLLILPLMLILLVGNVMSVKNFLTASDRTTLSKILFWVITPAMLFRNAFHVDNTGLTGRDALVFCISTGLAALLTMFTAYVMECTAQKITSHDDDTQAKDKDDRSNTHAVLAVSASIRPNTVYVGLPTVLAVWGESGLAPLSIYLAIAIPLYNILSPLSIEILSAQGTGNWQTSVKKAMKSTLRNPIVMSAMTGMILFAFGVELPESLDKSLGIMGSAATALALLLVGASIDIRSLNYAVLAITSCWCDVLTRLFIHPAMLYVCLTLMGITGLLRNVSVLVTATPTAVAFFVLAKGLHLDEERAGKMTVVTTLLSVITMPLWIALL